MEVASLELGTEVFVLITFEPKCQPPQVVESGTVGCVSEIEDGWILMDFEDKEQLLWVEPWQASKCLLALGEEDSETDEDDALHGVQAWSFTACPSREYAVTNTSLKGRFMVKMAHSPTLGDLRCNAQIVTHSQISGTIHVDFEGKLRLAKIHGQVMQDMSLVIQVGDVKLQSKPLQGQRLFDQRGGFLDLIGEDRLTKNLHAPQHAWRLYTVIACSNSAGPSLWTHPDDQFMIFLMGTHLRAGAQSPIKRLGGRPLCLIRSFMKRAPAWGDLEDEVDRAGLHLCDIECLWPELLVNEYLHFLTLKVEQQDWNSLKLSPPPIQYKGRRLIDEVWHVHIAMNCYAEDCKLISGGHVISHEPTTARVAAERYRFTYCLYQSRCKLLGTDINDCCWPDPAAMSPLSTSSRGSGVSIWACS